MEATKARLEAPREAYGKALAQLGGLNEKVVVLDADTAKSTRSALFAQAFPDRFFNMGVSEQDAVGTAAGLATMGLIPFVNIFACFITKRSLDQVSNLVAYPKLNVKLAGAYGGLSDALDGATHQAVDDLAIMRAMPNVTVVVATDAIMAAKATPIIAEHQGPVYFRLGRDPIPVIYDDHCPFEVGRAILHRKGSDVAIIACGLMVAEALEAAAALEEEGISAGVLDMPTLKPLDVEAVIEMAEEAGAIVTAEEHTIIGGLGGAVAEALAENCPTPLRRVGIRDMYGQSGVYRDLLAAYGLTEAGIIEAVHELLRKKG